MGARTEKYQAHLPPVNLEYDIVYSDRRTIGVTVERDRRVVVRAPKTAPPQAVAAAVEQKRLWIWSKLRDPRKYPEPRPRKEFVTGEAFLFRGQSFRLQLVSEPRGQVRFNGHSFEMSREDLRKARELFVAWYRAEAKVHLKQRAEAMGRAMGIAVKRVTVREMIRRWGSCSPCGTLTFNWRIVQAPIGVVDYLIAHEVAHVIVPNHAPEFWNIVAVHAPAWENARSWLRHHGGRLEW
jgi:predicted metal-dependent hydrolase